MEEKKVTPIKAIRAKCLDCCCGSSNEVKLCPCQTCPLWPFREGKNPYRKKVEYTPEQLAAMTERLMKNNPKLQGEKTENPAEV